MTIYEAKTALTAQYIAAGLIGPIPKPIIGVKVSTYDGGEVLRIDLNAKAYFYTPEESKPGVGYEGFRCVAWRMASLVSDSGPIA